MTGCCGIPPFPHNTREGWGNHRNLSRRRPSGSNLSDIRPVCTAPRQVAPPPHPQNEVKWFVFSGLYLW